MSNNQTPNLEAVIDFAWASGASIELINEAKKELKNLVESLQLSKKIIS